MAQPYVGEIRMFAGNFAPQYPAWMFCEGQLLPISENEALFQLIGTTYGGDGESTFALPDLRGCAPMHPGQGPGLSPRDLGETGGSATVTLLDSEMPAHSHQVLASARPAEENDAQGQYWASTSVSLYTPANQGLQPMAPEALALAGGGQPHNNLQPYLTCSFCIALQGVFPPRPPAPAP